MNLFHVRFELEDLDTLSHDLFNVHNLFRVKDELVGVVLRVVKYVVD